MIKYMYVVFYVLSYQYYGEICGYIFLVFIGFMFFNYFNFYIWFI